MDEKPNRRPLSDAEPELKAVGKIIVKAAASTVPFFGELAISSIAEWKRRISEAIQKQQDEALNAFFSALYSGETELEDSVALAMLDSADFHALARACLADLEAEKTSAYANMARAVATGRVEDQWKRHFILSLKDMSHEELSYLQKAYVINQHCLVSPQERERTQLLDSSVLRSAQPGSAHAVAVLNLTAKGFCHDNRLSETGVAFVQACFADDMLTPTAVGYAEWLQRFVLVVNYMQPLNDETMFLPGDLNRSLQEKGIAVRLDRITRDNLKVSITNSTMAVLLVALPTDQINEHADVLREYSCHCPLIVAYVFGQPIALPDGIRVHHTLNNSGKADLAECLATYLMSNQPSF